MSEPEPAAYLAEVSTDYALITKLIAETSDEARPTLLRLIKRLIAGIESHDPTERVPL